MTRIAAAAAVLGLMLAHMLAYTPAALGQAVNCAWYADTSLKQQQQNEQRKCGFTGPEWSANRQAHLAWCATQPPDVWKARAQKREQQLATCKK